MQTLDTKLFLKETIRFGNGGFIALDKNFLPKYSFWLGYEGEIEQEKEHKMYRIKR